MYPLPYLALLAQRYPSIQSAAAAIVDLTAQLHLPKGTEHFLSDVHGEYEAFRHVLKNASGALRQKIDDLFRNELSADERRALASLIYYPEEKLPMILGNVADQDEWYRITLTRLVRLFGLVSHKYPRARVRGFMPQGLAEVIEELLYPESDVPDKREYHATLLEATLATDCARGVVIGVAELLQRLAVARLHVIGDIYDRGPAAEQIMDTLAAYHSVDIQWGNHDIVWMGAAAGSAACIANVVRIALRYGNVSTLENGYGVSLLPLASFAVETYGDDPCARFIPSSRDEHGAEDERLLVGRMHKAIMIIQLKLEAEIIARRPSYGMEDRLLLGRIDHARGVVPIDGVEYPLLDTRFPTVDPAQPYALTPREKSVVDRLILSFTSSRRLQKHVRLLYSKGGMYRVYNGNLLYHGCIPMNEDGSFRALEIGDEELAARDLMDRLDRMARQGYFATDDPAVKQQGMDTMWYLWSGAQSPLFGKEKMATFERYLINDPVPQEEQRNAYYDHRDSEEAARRILAAFDVNPDRGHIINGHVPVKVKKGENPVKAGGKVIVIDGGFARAYHSKTGIAGYTLVFDSHGLMLAAHRPFESAQKAVEEGLDIESTLEVLEHSPARLRVKDTDQGRDYQQQIEALRELLAAYRGGLIQEA